MKMTMGSRLLVALFAPAALLAGESAVAAGLMNMPTSLRQCLGYGCGAGYHAPIQLALPGTVKTASQPVRYNRRPGPPASCASGFCGSSSSLAGVNPESYYYQAPMHPVASPGYYNDSQPTQIFAAPDPLPQRLPATRPARGRAEPQSPSDSSTPETLPLPNAGP